MSQLYFKSKRKLWLKATLGYLLIVFSAILPILIAISAGTIAKSYGCTANEAGSYPCIIGDTDYGGLISLMGVFGWFFFISFPSAFVGLILWTTRVRKELRFQKYGARYMLTDLEDLSVNNFEGQVY